MLYNFGNVCVIKKTILEAYSFYKTKTGTVTDENITVNLYRPHRKENYMAQTLIKKEDGRIFSDIQSRQKYSTRS